MNLDLTRIFILYSLTNPHLNARVCDWSIFALFWNTHPRTLRRSLSYRFYLLMIHCQLFQSFLFHGINPSFLFPLKKYAMFTLTEPSLLPSSFNNEVVHTDNNNEYLIRSSVKSMQDINTWVQEFGFSTKTQWNSRTSKPQGERIVCK